MITVTLGTIPFPFERAIIWLKALLDDGTISEPVFVQAGITDVSLIQDHPLIETAEVIESARLKERIKQSRLVISHAGQGSTRMLAAQQASFILLPRLAKYAEHIDDHQLSFARSVRPYGVTLCTEFEELKQAVIQPPPCFEGELLNEPRLSDYLISMYPGSASAVRPPNVLSPNY